MADKTLGQILFEQQLPDDVRLEGVATKKELRRVMSDYAKRDPKGYIETIQKVKRFGDEVATYEGISVGLEDIAPDTKRRDPIINKALADMKSAKSVKAKRAILKRAEKDIQTITKEHPSDMTLMAKSGGRGSINQLMKTVASPIAAGDSDGNVVPWLITRSYAQGLKPSEVWVSAAEARRNAIMSTGSVVEPGAVAKVVVSNMEDLVITENDCGTSAGVSKKIDDINVRDRYLTHAQYGVSAEQPLDDADIDIMRGKGAETVAVRSPMTCDVNDGVCQRCMGSDAWGKPYRVGTNVGTRSAQAMTEPLTQFALNAKHGVRLAGSDKGKLKGLHGFRVLTEVPKSFMEKATLAKNTGSVTRVEKAPQGGHFIHVGATKHYAIPGLDPVVKVGTRVEAGDALSEGTAMPNEVVKYKGIGAGREHLSAQLIDLYGRQGVDIDHRHTELLARKALNYVQVDEDPSGTHIPGDVVRFDRLRGSFRKSKKSVKVGDAEGMFLAAPLLHYTEGTELTKNTLAALKAQGVLNVEVSDKGPRITPIMKSIIQTPLMNDDWMSRLSHRYLKRTLLEGAGMGHSSDTNSTAPVPAYVATTQFGRGTDGKYAMDESVAKVAGMLSRSKKLVTNLPLPEMTPKGVGAGVKNFLFGKGTINSSRANPALISTKGMIGGGMDNTAIDAMRMRKHMGGEAFDRLDITNDKGVLTDVGARRLEAIQDTLPGAFKGRKKKMLTPDDRKALIAQGVDPNNIDAAYAALAKGRGGALKRTGVALKDALIGEAPLKVLKQRYDKGGVIGRGGLLTGDMALDPDFIRAAKKFKENPSMSTGASAAMQGGMDIGNKALSYGMPGYAVYQAATSEPAKGESKWEQMATPIGDTVGWGLGGPFGFGGGMLIAGQVTDGFKNVARRLDPNAPAQKPQPAAPTSLRSVGRDLWDDSRTSLMGTPAYTYYNTAQGLPTSASQYVHSLQRQQQLPARPTQKSNKSE